MQRTIHFTFFRNVTLLGLATQLFCSLNAQTTVLPSQTVLPVQGSAVITNYSTTGPGLPTSTLFESRHALPPGVPSNQAIAPGRPLPLPPAGVDVDYTRGPAAAAFSPAPGRLEPIRSVGNQLPLHPEEPSYTFPGLVTRFAGEWVGSEYLFDLPPDIGIVVDVVTPDNFPLRLNRGMIRDAMADIFAQGNINPVAQSAGDQAPLPFLQLLIFIQNTEESSVAFVSGRLFEGVRLLRLDYALPGTIQAITWEMQSLLVDAPNRLEKQIISTAETIASSFVGRVAYFARLKLEQEEDLRLRCSRYSQPSGKGALMAPPVRKKRPTPAPTPAPALPARPSGMKSSGK